VTFDEYTHKGVTNIEIPATEFFIFLPEVLHPGVIGVGEAVEYTKRVPLTNNKAAN
jgi:hypothetical protein